MTIFLSSLLLGLAAAPPPARDLRIEPRNELERRVLSPIGRATTLTEEWLATFGADRARLEAELAAAGFTLQKVQDERCRWFGYRRPAGSNQLERTASIALCPDKPFVTILSILPSAGPPGPGAPGIRAAPLRPDEPVRNPR
jgi:hypothetical protein